MDLPKPPEDQELRNIIDKLAQFVARNGLEFEQMTKNKQKENLKFAFLFGGEYFNYYQYKVTTEQAILKQKQKVMEQQALVQHTITQQSIQSAPWQHHVQQQQIQEQVQQSEHNLAAQHQALIQQQQVQIDEAIRKAQEQKLQELAKELEIDLQMCDKIMQPIIDSCTKDAISAGKGWIFNNAISFKHCEVISRYLLKRVTTLGTSFELKLHLVYLINDVLHHCVRKNADELKKALEAMVIPVFCTTSLGASDEQKQKLSKLLKLWESNNYFEPDVLQQLKNPAVSLAAYQTNLITTNASVITPITTAIQNQYAVLQKQHQDFVAHIRSQLQTPSAVPVSAQQSTTTGSEKSIVDALVGSANPIPIPPTNSSIEVIDLSRSPPPGSSTTAAAAASGGSAGSGAALSFAQAPPSFPPNFSHPPPNFTHPPPGFIPNFQQPPPNFQQPPPGLPVTGFTPAGLPLPDLSKPPPCFPVRLPPPHQAPVIDLNDPNLMPSVPYFELPAGLMAPLVKLEEFEYRPLDPDEIRLPPPAPPSERLLAAVELFYTPPSHERPRNSEGWEQLGLYEFFKAKSQAKKRKEEEGKEIPPPQSPPRRARSRSQSTERPVVIKSKSPPVPKRRYNEHRAKSRSKSRSRSRSKSASPLPYKRTSRSRSRSYSPKRIRSRSISRSQSRSPSPSTQRKRSASRSPTPPSFFGSTYSSTILDRRLDESNKGHQLMKKMGWSGQGLGATEQGISDPIQAADVRDRQDQYKGIGINLNDPFETFRKNKGQAFINRMRARAEEKLNH